MWAPQLHHISTLPTPAQSLVTRFQLPVQGPVLLYVFTLLGVSDNVKVWVLAHQVWPNQANSVWVVSNQPGILHLRSGNVKVVDQSHNQYGVSLAVWTQDWLQLVFMAVHASAFAKVVATLNVFASTLIAQYLVLALNQVGKAQVVVKYILSHVCSQWELSVATHGLAIVIVNVHSEGLSNQNNVAYVVLLTLLQSQVNHQEGIVLVDHSLISQVIQNELLTKASILPLAFSNGTFPLSQAQLLVLTNTQESVKSIWMSNVSSNQKLSIWDINQLLIVILFTK